MTLRQTIQTKEEKEIYLRENLDDVMTNEQIDFVLPYFLNYPFRLKIIPKRNTYSGLCRMPRVKGDEYVISVAYNPVKAVFFIIFLHEIAHMVVNHEKGRKISSSHGFEWSNAFRLLLTESAEKECYTPSEKELLTRFLKSGKKVTNKAMSAVELNITDLYATGIIRLGTIPENVIFTLKNGMVLKKIKKVRTRFHCVEPATGRQFRVHSAAEVMSWKSE